MQMMLVLLLVLQPLLVYSQTCPTGWQPYSDSCFRLSSDWRSYYEAQQMCQTESGDLALAKPKDLNTFLTGIVSNAGAYSAIIGLHDMANENQFYWVDGTALQGDEQVWNPGEPNDVNGEDCVELLSGGKWNDVPCTYTLQYICQRDNDVPITCDEGDDWYSTAGKCYKFYNSLKTWQDAENYCQAVSAQLISISDQEEQNFATNQANFGGYTLWTGLTDIILGVAGSYQWSSGEGVTFTNWAPNQPDSRFFTMGGDCVEILDTSSNGEWSTAACTSTRTFICERPEGTCTQGWRLFRGYCYQFNTQTALSWTNSKFACESQNAYLLTDLSTVENNFVVDQLVDYAGVGVDSTWMGLSDSVSDGSFAWVEGSSLGYMNWDSSNGQPVDTVGQADCAYVYTADGVGKWSTSGCSSTRSYVCKVRTGQPVNPYDPTKGIGSCDPGWTLNGDSCYYFDLTGLSFNDAETQCMNSGAHLTSILNDEEQNFLSMRAGMAGAYLWIGLHDISLEGNFIWVDGSQFLYSNWAPDQPDNWGSTEDCGHLRPWESEEGKWNDIGCDTQFGYICKKAKIPGPSTAPIPVPTPKFDPRCGAGWEYESTSGNCYLFRPTDYNNWQDARTQCKLQGGDLISVGTKTEQLYVNARIIYITEGGFWGGGNDINSEGGWEWSDGSGFAYLNWNPGEPNDYSSGEHCMQIYRSNGKWNDLFCDRSLGYICEKNGYLTTHFNVNPNMFLPGYDTMTISNSYPDECAQMCVKSTSFTCRSFDYRRQTQECALSDTASTTSGLTSDSTTDYYQRLMDVVDPVPTTLPPGYRCRSGWYSYGSFCYYASATIGSYTTARSKCQSLGGDLVSIHDVNENSYVQALATSAGITGSLWIGLNDLQEQMTYVWSDNTPVDYTRWSNNEPNNYEGLNEDCTEMYTNGAWNDISCANTLGSVCKRTKESLPPTDQPVTASGCTLGEIAYGASCYQVMGTAISWSDAQDSCLAYGGNLVSIGDRYEQSVVSSQLGLEDGTLVWIGLNDRTNPGQYVWSDNTPVTYTNWDVGHPDDSAGKCVASTSGSIAGLWRNIACSSAQKHMCERVRGGYTAPPTVPPPQPPTVPNNDNCYYGWKGYGAYCYLIVSSDVSGSIRRPWATARSFCTNMHEDADLASFHSQDEEDYIAGLGDSATDIGYWIGLHDRSAEAGFEWTDQTPVDHTNWSPGEPNNYGSLGEDCTEMFFTGRGWNDENCQALRNWICKLGKGKLPRTTQTPTTVTPWPACDTDADWIKYTGNNYCYFFSAGLSSSGRNRNWRDANNYCMANGGYLASIHNYDENNFAMNYLTRYTGSQPWIGLREYTAEGVYSWSDGSALDFQSWGPNEPNDANGEEQCAEMYSWDGSWNDVNCGKVTTFICRKPNGAVAPITPYPTPSPEGNCRAGYLRFGNRCYKFNGENADDRKSWYDARDACRSEEGSDLITIHSQELQSYLTSKLKGIDYRLYIGLSDTLNNGQFHWTDGSPVDYTNWDSGEPNDAGRDEDCGELIERERDAGQWNDRQCNVNNGYICQTPLDLNAPAPTEEPNSCREGFTQYYDSCFMIPRQTYNYNGALQACQDQGDDVYLASIIDPYEQAYCETLVHSNGGSPLWIGLYDDKTSGQYIWTDGWPVWFTYWGQNEPSMGGGEGCVALEPTGGWNDTQCTNVYKALCKYSTVPTPTDHPDTPGNCPLTWDAYGGNCYKIENNLLDLQSWPEVEYLCEQLNATLASVHSKQELQFLFNKMKDGRNDVWIGLNRAETGGFAWKDGTPVDFTNWALGQPTYETEPGTEDCVEMYQDDGKWNDVPCIASSIGSNIQGYICKKPKAASPNPEDPNQLSSGAIAGIVIGCLIGVCLIGLGAFFIVTWNQTSHKQPTTTEIPDSIGFDNALYKAGTDNIKVSNPADSKA